MAVSHAAAAIILAGSLTACTSSGSPGNSSGPPSGSGSSSAGSCTKATAKTAQQTLITTAGFSPSCVKIKAKAKFFFVNNEQKHHTATANPGSPTSFDADLTKKGSTYTQAFKKNGTYIILDKITKKSMTLYVG